jgi:hypothetical protein
MLIFQLNKTDGDGEISLQTKVFYDYSRTLDCEQLGLRVFYKTSKNFEGILTW